MMRSGYPSTRPALRLRHSRTETCARHRRFEDYYQRLARSSFDVAFECAPEAEGVSLRQAWTTALREAAGRPGHQTALPDAWLLFVHPDDRAIVEHHLQHVSRGRRDVCGLRVSTAAGGTRWIAASTRPVWEEQAGRVVNVYGPMRDLTDFVSEAGRSSGAGLASGSPVGLAPFLEQGGRSC